MSVASLSSCAQITKVKALLDVSKGAGGASTAITGLQPLERPGMRDWDTLAVPGLVPTLRDYQKKTVAWMISQESRRLGLTGDGWLELPTSEGDSVFVSIFGARVVDQRPVLPLGKRGGIS